MLGYVPHQRVLRPKPFTYFIHDMDNETGILFIHFKHKILEECVFYPLENLIKIQENLRNLENQSGKI